MSDAPALPHATPYRPNPAAPPDGRYLTFPQAARRYEAFSVSSFRWMRFNGDENGFNACVIKIGRRVLLDIVAFEAWLLSHHATLAWVLMPLVWVAFEALLAAA